MTLNPVAFSLFACGAGVEPKDSVIKTTVY